ncbi:aldehyde dehydrogenase [Pelistega indica]|uniref:Aldehyde dehydrogenase n=1 Tax=Pelistega indica TaxID=1414851 RepID=V8G714_9BURK|nr:MULTISPECIES: aldehyde dehydrogenase family protein [Pelistega]ETD72205.1 aldehyde dehydrogenase [Pelistega indica]
MKVELRELIQKIAPSFEQIASYINGEWVVGGQERISVKSSFDKQEIFAYSDANTNIISVLNKCTKLAQSEWRSLTAAERGRRIFKLGAIIRSWIPELAEIESLSSNKALGDAKVEVLKVAEMFEYYAGWTDKLHGDVIAVPTTHLNYTLLEPLGVVFQITPWNAPIFTAGWQIAPAITAGNSVILKPSELTPITSLLIAFLSEQARIPRGLINVVAGYGHTIGQAIINECDIQKVVFVGSPATGKKISIAAAQKGVPSILELGGKSANIVFDDCDYDAALKGAQSAIFSGTGQSCVSGSRVLIQKSIYERFTNDLARATKKFIVGNPIEATTQIAPIHNEKQYQHVKKMIEKALSDGATVPPENANPLPQNTGYIVNPTVLLGHNQMKCAQEEIFGPVVVAIPFETEEEAIALANDSKYGLAGAVWTNNVARAHRIAQKINAGTFWINGYKTIHVSSPFGGYGESGYGRSSGIEALRAYSQVKSVWVETAKQSSNVFGYSG